MDPKPPSLDALRIDRTHASPGSGGRGGKWWVILLLLLLLGGGGGGWWFLRNKGVTVKTATVKIQSQGENSGGRAHGVLDASGYVTTRLSSTVSSKITGKVTQILVEEGMRVEKDQVVARLDSSNAETGLRLAQAQLESAKLNLAETEPMAKYTEAEMKRYSGLEGSRAVSNTEIAKAAADSRTQQAKLERQRADVIVAERQVDDWKQQLDDTIIRAPFSGIVTTKDSQPGEMISPMSAGGGFTRTGICTLVDMSSLEIEVDVGERFIKRVKAGQPVEATLDAYPEWQIPAKVIAIIPTADRQKATVKVRIAFDKLDPQILPEMGVKVSFLSDEVAEPGAAPKAVVSIPKAALQKDGGTDIAWVVKDDKVERRAVKVGDAGGDLITVEGGLSQGEAVVLDPPSTLADGASVSVEKSQ